MCPTLRARLRLDLGKDGFFNFKFNAVHNFWNQ